MSTPAHASTALRTVRASRSGRRTTTETLLARVVARMVERAAAEGMNREAIIDAAGLRAVDLADGDARVPISTQVALWQLLAKGVSDPGVGLRMGASFKVREAGLLGYVMEYSATLGIALDRLVRYSCLLNDAVECTLERPDAQHVAVAQFYPEHGIGLPLAVDYRLAALVSVVRQITGAELVPHEVAFVYPEPSNTLEHRRFFRCDLRFGEPIAKVVFHERDLRLRVRHGDETLVAYLSGPVEQALRALVVGSSFRERARAAIWNTLSDGRPTLARIASALRLAPRTLQRRLAHEGTCLQREVEEIRKAMAMAMLRERANSIDEVAFLLGYPEPSTLFRSFKRWTGMTPHQYRSALA